jgi:hypothetical protein
VAYPHVDLRIAPRNGIAVLAMAVRGDVLVVAAHQDGDPLRVQLEREQRDDGASRETRIRRRVWRESDGETEGSGAPGELIDDAVIVDDHQRIPARATPRTSHDCGETACRARIEIPAAHSEAR